MVKNFVDIWNDHKGEILSKYEENGTPLYNHSIVKDLVQLLHDHTEDYRKPDPDRIHHIDDGDYQGTDVFVVGATGYQPSQYWVAKQYYGSCSGCDQLLAINRSYRDGDKEQAMKDIERYALNVLQSFKEV